MLNREIGFGDEEEQNRLYAAKNEDFCITSGKADHDGFRLEPSRGFGDFGFKIDGNISFDNWNQSKYGGLQNNFKVLIASNEAEYSFITLGKDIQALIMGCDGIWETNKKKTVADIFDAFYFKNSDLQVLKSELLK